MIEAFSADRSESIEEIIWEWPATRFEKLYEAFARRKVADDLANKRLQEMAAIWGNSNLDNEGIQGIKDSIDETYSSAIKMLYSDEEFEVSKEQEIDWDDPFFAPVKRTMDKIDKHIKKD